MTSKPDIKPERSHAERSTDTTLHSIGELSAEFGISTRAIRFYERNGFVHAGEDVNPTSGRPVLKMMWRA